MHKVEFRQSNIAKFATKFKANTIFLSHFHSIMDPKRIAPKSGGTDTFTQVALLAKLRCAQNSRHPGDEGLG